MRGARAALRLLDDPTRFLSTVQVGITLVGVFAGAYSGATLAEPLSRRAAGCLRAATAYPRRAGDRGGRHHLSLARRRRARAEAHRLQQSRAHRRARSRRSWRGCRSPARRSSGSCASPPMRWSSSCASRTSRTSPVTEEEVKRLIAEGTRTGVFHAAERDMINGVLRLADRSVRSVMTPRVEVVWIDLDDPPETIRSEIAESGHSRYPGRPQGPRRARGHRPHQAPASTRWRAPAASTSPPRSASRSSCTRRRRCSGCWRCSARTRSTWRWWSTNTACVEGIVTPTDILTAIAGELPEDVDRPRGGRRRCAATTARG